jgi:hypothetical protein
MPSEERIDINDINSLPTLLSKFVKKVGAAEAEFAPVHRFGQGISYDLGGVSIPYDRAQAAEKEGLLLPVRSESFCVCPKCHDHSVTAALKCPDCKSRTLQKSEIMIHYQCDYSGPVHEFTLHDGSGTLTCPKCHKEIKRVGIDYGKPGIGFKCLLCSSVFQYPAVGMICQGGHESRIDELELVSFPIYKVGQKVHEALAAFETVAAAQKVLADKSYAAQMFAQVRGESGSLHIVPLLVTRNGMAFAIEFIAGADYAKSGSQILQIILKYADLSHFRVLLFASNSIKQSLEALVNPKKVKLVASVIIPPSSDEIVAEVLKNTDDI